MSEKANILGMAAQKISLDNRFLGFLMNKYSEYENISEKDLQSQLRCSEENYYKLCLCKIPDLESETFLQRLNSIGEYANVFTTELNRIIKRSNAIIKLSEGEEQKQSYLMAARDKHEEKE